MNKQIKTSACESLVIAANSARGTHSDSLTCTLDMSIDKYLLVTAGSASGHVRTCGADDAPIGVATDDGKAGDVINVALLGLGHGTLLIRTDSAIKMGDWVYSTGRGRVFTGVPATTGTFYYIGMAVADAPAGGLVEVNTCVAHETRVLSKDDMKKLQKSEL